MKELFVNTYVENNYLIQRYEDFQNTPKHSECTWSSENEEPYVQLPEGMLINPADRVENIVVPSYILYNDTYYQVYLPNDCSFLWSSSDTSYINLDYVIDTSNVTNMAHMFHNCVSLTRLDISNFDTSNVTDMAGMFYYCESLTSLDLSNLDTSNVINMRKMFYKCPARELYKDDKRFMTAFE